MLSYLIKLYNQDSDYIIILHLEGLSNKLTGLFWITS